MDAIFEKKKKLETSPGSSTDRDDEDEKNT